MSKEREQKILAYMKNEIKTKGYPPTVREICSAPVSYTHLDVYKRQLRGYPGQSDRI